MTFSWSGVQPSKPKDKGCPLCGSRVVYQGLTDIECVGPACVNLTKKPEVQVTIEKTENPWWNPNGRVLCATELPPSCFAWACAQAYYSYEVAYEHPVWGWTSSDPTILYPHDPAHAWATSVRWRVQ